MSVGGGPRETSEKDLIRTAPAPSDHVAADLARSILPSSGTMIGICTTLIGLVKINERTAGESQVDEYGALIAIAFLVSALLSYLSMRLAGHRPSLARKCERSADAIFLLGLVALVGLAATFAFEMV